MERKTTIILAILIALIACGVAISLFASPSSMSSSGNQTITDMANRTVNIPGEINRVVATSPPMTTIMYMLAPEKLAGVNFQWTDEELKYVPDQYKDKFPVVGGWFGSQDGNYEEFIASEPDFVVESIDEGMGVDLSTVYPLLQKGKRNSDHFQLWQLQTIQMSLKLIPPLNLWARYCKLKTRLKNSLISMISIYLKWIV